MDENYIMLNGRRINLTEEEIEEFNNRYKINPFKRACPGKGSYYCILSDGDVVKYDESGYTFDDNHYRVGNYCTDQDMMEQRALHETLDRLLWRFSMQNEGDKIDWDDKDKAKYYIHFDTRHDKFSILYNHYLKYSSQYFYTEEIAQRAINEIVIPFVKEHPEFVW